MEKLTHSLFFSLCLSNNKYINLILKRKKKRKRKNTTIVEVSPMDVSMCCRYTVRWEECTVSGYDESESGVVFIHTVVSYPHWIWPSHLYAVLDLEIIFLYHYEIRRLCLPNWSKQLFPSTLWSSHKTWPSTDHLVNKWHHWLASFSSENLGNKF